MTTQTEMFPKTTTEVLESLRAFHHADVEKAGAALDNLDDDEKIARRYEKAEERLAAARDLVRDIDRAIKELRGIEPTVEDAVRDMKRTAEESGTRVTLSTGGKSVTFGGNCDSCGNDDCNLRQREGTRHTGCDGAGWRSSESTDPITGEIAHAVVVALYPGDDEPHVTKVGDRTRYSELVADYFTEAGLSAEVDADEWGVDARRELTQDGGGYRSLHDIIIPEDYGQELLVVALEQGSVTGAAAEKVAT